MEGLKRYNIYWDYFNAFGKKEEIQDIWDISDIRRLERVILIEKNAFRIQNTREEQREITKEKM